MGEVEKERISSSLFPFQEALFSVTHQPPEQRHDPAYQHQREPQVRLQVRDGTQDNSLLT